MDYVKCWECGPSPLYPAVMVLVVLALAFAVWKAMRPPRPPDWWRKSRGG